MYISSVVDLQENLYKVAVCLYCILSGIHLQKSRYKVAVYISYHVVILRKVYIKLWNAYIITCSPAGKLIKVAAGLYYHVFICMNANI